MGYQETGEIFIRVSDKTGLEKAEAIFEKYEVNNSSSGYGEMVCSNVWIDCETVDFDSLRNDVIAAIPDCLMLASISKYHSVSGYCGYDTYFKCPIEDYENHYWGEEGKNCPVYTNNVTTVNSCLRWIKKAGFDISDKQEDSIYKIWGQKKEIKKNNKNNDKVLEIKLMNDPAEMPNVLFVGNGLLRLNKGLDWSELLGKIRKNDEELDLSKIPFSMQPEALCGYDVEKIQKNAAEVICDGEPHELLKKLLSMNFDAIITTNYTYEIEQVLTGGKWNNNMRRKSFLCLHGSPHAKLNTNICYLVETTDGREIPVFHIHGDYLRKHSLVLSYYSYANSVAKLIEMNKLRSNSYMEKAFSNEKLQVLSWLDYFIYGKVYVVGFGFDFSEFDIWWAIERKGREIWEHGNLSPYITYQGELPYEKKAMLNSLDVYWPTFVEVKNDDFEREYEGIICDIAFNDDDLRNYNVYYGFEDVD